MKIQIMMLVGILVSPSQLAAAGDDHHHDEKKEAAWFTHEKLDHQIWMINDNNVDNIYLVEGDDTALIIDTGIGYSNLKEYASNLTDKPIAVVNSHAHPDHAGGNIAFPHIHIHTDDAELLKFHTSEEMMAFTYKAFLQRSLPDQLKDENIAKRPDVTTIQEGFSFDLGGRRLEVLHVPGHTMGSIALHDNLSKNLFTGDSTPSHIWLFLPESAPVETFLKSLNKMHARKDDINLLLAGHEPPKQPDFLGQQIKVVEKILSGECKGEPYQSPTGIAGALFCVHGPSTIVFQPDNIFEDDQ